MFSRWETEPEGPLSLPYGTLPSSAMHIMNAKVEANTNNNRRLINGGKTKKRHNKGGVTYKKHSVRKSMIKSDLKKPINERDFGVKTVSELERTMSKPSLTVSSKTIKQKQILADRRQKLMDNAPESILIILNKQRDRKPLNRDEKSKLEEYKKQFQKK